MTNLSVYTPWGEGCSMMKIEPTMLDRAKHRFGIKALYVPLDEVERLRETLNHPRLTTTAPVEQIKAVLHDWEKGCEVNGQDLINALAWRVRNQTREIARLHERLRSNGGLMECKATSANEPKEQQL
jgi:hypothetical protein